MGDKNTINGNIKGIGVMTGGEAHISIINEKNYQIPKQLTKTTGLNSNFIGRTKELKEIETKFQNNNSLLLINGIGGIGKSSLAVEFLKKNKEKYNHFGFVVALNDIKSALFNELHADLRLRDYGKIDENFAEALRGLRVLQGDKLLVVDDVQDIENQKEAIEALLGLSANGYKILFTSRRKLKNVSLYNLGSLNPQDAKKLFLTHYQTKELDKVQTIVEYLGYHALFVELVAKTVENEGYSLDEIIEKFNSEALTKIEYTDEDDDGKESTLSKNLNELFEMQKKEISDEYLLLLKRLATLPSIAIEYSKLNNILDVKKGKLNFLVGRGWLIENEGSYKLHQIIKEYILAFHLPRFNEIEEVLDYFNNEIDGVEDIQKSVELRDDIIYFESLDRALTIVEEENEKVADFFNQFGLIHYHLGAYKKAEPLYLKALKIGEEVLGETHPDTARSYNNLAELYRSMGTYKKAEPLFLKALKINEEILGETHPNTASGYNNLASLYQSMGAYEKAESLHLKALKISEEILGKTHPDTATSYNNLAELYRSMGAYEKAEPLFLKALKINEEILGENHLATTSSYNSLAGLYMSIGAYKKAEPLYLKSLKVNEEVLGETHPDTTTSYNNLAELYRSIGAYEKAKPLYLKAVKIREEVLGENHPDTTSSYNNLAILYDSMGTYKKAEPLYLKALKIREEVLGENHPNTAESYNNVAIFYYNTDELEKAYEFMRKAVEVMKRVLLENHPHLIHSKKGLEMIERKLKSKTQITSFQKIGRNSPCSCNSGKKYKKCCGK